MATSDHQLAHVEQRPTRVELPSRVVAARGGNKPRSQRDEALDQGA